MPGEETVTPTRINLLSTRSLSAPPSGGLRVFHANHASPRPQEKTLRASLLSPLAAWDTVSWTL